MKQCSYKALDETTHSNIGTTVFEECMKQCIAVRKPYMKQHTATIRRSWSKYKYTVLHFHKNSYPVRIINVG